jgi:hypothetical protein
MKRSRSQLEVLDERHVGIDAFDEGGVGGGVREVGGEHLLGLHLESLQLVAFIEVLLLGEVVDEVVDALEAVLNLHEVGLDVGARRELGSAVPNGPELQSVRLPVVVVQLLHELVALLVVHLRRVEVLRHVAGHQVESVRVGIERLNNRASTSIASIFLILFSMVGKWNS